MRAHELPPQRVTPLLVSCSFGSFDKSSDQPENLFSGLIPDEWLRVVVPGSEPGADIGRQGPDRATFSAAYYLIGDVGEPPLYLIDPAELLGVKCIWNLGLASSHFRMAGLLWVP